MREAYKYEEELLFICDIFKCIFYNCLDAPHHTYKHSAQDCIADEGSSAYCQSSGAHNTHINLLKLALRGHLNTDAQVRDRTRNTKTMP